MFCGAAFPGMKAPVRGHQMKHLLCYQNGFLKILEFSGIVAGWVIPCPVFFVIESASP